jgi:hypothetical protein
MGLFLDPENGISDFFIQSAGLLVFLFVRLIFGPENGNSTYLLVARNKPNKLAACLVDLFFNPEDGSNMFLLAVSSKQKKVTSCLLGLLVNPEVTAARASGTSINFHQTTWRHAPENCTLW